jgi:hypothetical protein
MESSSCTHLDHVRITRLPDSIEPGEEWSWCFLHDLAPLITAIQGETRIPPPPLG